MDTKSKFEFKKFLNNNIISNVCFILKTNVKGWKRVLYKWHSYITDFIRLTIRLFYFYNDYIYNGAKMLQQLSSLHKILHQKLLLKLQFGPTVGQVKLGSKCFFVEISMYIFYWYWNERRVFRWRIKFLFYKIQKASRQDMK